MRVIFGAMLAFGALSAAHAEPIATCAPPPAFASWAKRPPLIAATRAAGTAMPELRLGEAADLTLAPIGSLALAVPLGKLPVAGDHGGIVIVRIASSGTYRIALGARAWIDVAQGATPLASIGHAMGPACAGIAKNVDFALAPGLYTVQISAAADPVVPIAIARLP